MINFDIKVLILTALIGLFWCWFGAFYTLWNYGLTVHMFGVLTILAPITFVILRQAWRDLKS